MLNLPPFHQRILDVALTICEELGLYLAGGYAVRAHGLVERPSQDLDFATDNLRPLPEIIDVAAGTYRDAGFDVEITRGTPRMGQIVVTDPGTGELCKVDFLKEPLQKKPVLIGAVRVVALDDLVGMKATALASRGAPRDFIDVSAAAHISPFLEIERLIRLRNGDETSIPVTSSPGWNRWIAWTTTCSSRTDLMNSGSVRSADSPWPGPMRSSCGGRRMGMLIGIMTRISIGCCTPTERGRDVLGLSRALDLPLLVPFIR